MDKAPRILYCHCKYAKVVPPEVKGEVLRQLCSANKPFDAVADLCEMAARRDPLLQRLAEGGPLKIAACHPRAVKWLFASGGAPLNHEQVQILNMRTQSAEEVVAGLFDSRLEPNLPAGKPKDGIEPASVRKV